MAHVVKLQPCRRLSRQHMSNFQRVFIEDLTASESVAGLAVFFDGVFSCTADHVVCEYVHSLPRKSPRQHCPANQYQRNTPADVPFKWKLAPLHDTLRFFKLHSKRSLSSRHSLQQKLVPGTEGSPQSPLRQMGEGGGAGLRLRRAISIICWVSSAAWSNWSACMVCLLSLRFSEHHSHHTRLLALLNHRGARL